MNISWFWLCKFSLWLRAHPPTHTLLDIYMWWCVHKWQIFQPVNFVGKYDSKFIQLFNALHSIFNNLFRKLIYLTIRIQLQAGITQNEFEENNTMNVNNSRVKVGNARK